MARRRHDSEEIQADSILDVVANIVGILIILIVCAAVRAGNAPLELQALLTPPPDASSEATADGPPAAPPEPEPEPNSSASTPELPLAAQPMPLEAPPTLTAPIEPPQLLAPPKDIEPSAETIARFEQLQQQLDQLQAERTAALRALSSAGTAEEEMRQNIAALETQLKNAEAAGSARRSVTADSQSTINDIAAKLAAARRQLDALEKAKPPAKELRHRVTPVSRTITGHEVHFRLSEGRIAYVPMDEMKERLKLQIGKQREWLAKFRKHQGEIGPVHGFRMRYVVEREDSGVEDLRQGGMMRIVVSSFECVPDASLKGETAKEALKKNSSFQQLLRSASPEATLTFWVYPDSFGLYRDLTQFAHREGFTVAARPLPMGVQIAGSPKGSRSAGQ
jgi:hypothetical protein